MKRNLLFLLFYVLLPLTASAYDIKINNVCYNFYIDDPLFVPEEEATVSVTSPGSNEDRYSGHVVIPSTITTNGKTYKVVYIERFAFSGCENLHSISIGRNIKGMGDGAFDDCTGLQNVYITDLSAWCDIDFWTTRNMGGMMVQEHSRYSNPLYYAKHLFLNGQEITDLVIPEGVKSMSMQAFAHFSGLISATLPDDFEQFRPSLHQGFYYEESTGPFSDCPNLNNVKIGNSISRFKISDCPNLRTIILGNHVDQISICSCPMLNDVYCIGRPSSVSFCDDCQIESATLHVPNGDWLEIYKNSTPWSDFGTITGLVWGDPGYVTPTGNKINFADMVTASICLDNWDYNLDGQLSKEEAASIIDLGIIFKGNSDITSFNELRYFTGLQEIGNEAFRACSNLKSITLPNQVTSIGDYAFWGCQGLTSIVLPNNVTSIGNQAFYQCSSLENIPNIKNVKSFSDHAFYGCTGIHILDLPEGLSATFGQSVFGNLVLDRLTLPNSLSTVDNYLFHNTKVNKLVISPNVQTIGSDNFEPGVDEIHISDFSAWCKISFKTMDLGESLFLPHKLILNGEEVKSITIPQEITLIGDYQFLGLNNVTNISLHDGVTSIGGFAFSGITKVTDLNIPENVADIRNYAFYGDSGLTTVTSQIKYPNNIGYGAFLMDDNSKPTATLYVPNGTKSKYQSLSGWSDFENIVEMDGPAVIFELPVNETYFPDENFRNHLLTLTYFVKNGKITDVTNVTTLWCENKGIKSLKGIEYFPKLRNLYCYNNQLTDLDLSRNKLLKDLRCQGNLLTSLDISSITGLTRVDCFGNQLTSLDVSNNAALTKLDCSNNQLATLDVSDCAALTTLDCSNNQLTALNVSNNTELKELKILINCINRAKMKELVEGLPEVSSGTFYVKNCGNNNEHNAMTTDHVAIAKAKGWSVLAYYSKDNQWGDWDYDGEEPVSIDISTTNFPDDAFRDYIKEESIDKDQDVKLTGEEIDEVASINVNNLNIYDLKGIEFFTALTTLNCRFTKMTTIDVSQNTALTDLDCRNNNFTALDVTKNTALVSLKCARNKITALDVSKNTKLNLLRCNYNQLTALNVSKCTQLQRLDCFGNKIGKTAMDNLIASLPSTTNGQLYVIDTTLDSEENVCTTDQVAAAKAKGWTVYDYNNNSPVEYAGSTEQELGDLNGDNAVNGTDLVMQTTMILAGQYNAVADMNHDGVVNGTDYVLMVNKILSVSSAPMMMAPASASAGDTTLNIEDFTISTGETKEMLIDMNNPSDEITLIQFDLRLPDGLSIATEGGEMLIDIAGRTTWRKHSLNANTLGDVTRFLLSSPTNAVISGTSGAVISITLTASNNFNGGTIQLENQLLVTPSADETKPADYSFTIEGNVPQGISIDEANFPDQKFREYVSGASIDKNQDRRLSDEELAEVTTIDVSNQAISSLKGVEFFTSLTTLKCGKNNLKMLDVSKNTAISYLYCDNNPLSSLDVTNNVALELLSCFNNQLTSLDVSKNAALKYLYCDDNSLKSLDVTKNAALSILSCDDCQLSSLDLSNNPALTALSCNKNLFTSLDVSKNTALTTLYCYINSLTALDVSNNTSLSELYCDNNQLTTLDLSKNTALTTFTCFNNMISESEMDQLVNSLPTVSNGKAYMICTRSHTEENVVNTDQVALAKSKGWTVFDYNGTSSEEYEGSATTGISGIDWDASGKNVPIHTLSGQRLTTPKKGINIIGGKKVVVK